MVKLYIIEEDSGDKREIEFNSTGTFYELARAIRDKAKFNLPKIFKLLSQGRALKSTEEYTFSNEHQIKNRDLTNGSTDFLELSDSAPKWRIVDNGINLFGYCENKQCEAYKEEVIEIVQEVEIDICKKNGKMHCPICNCLVQIGTIGFFNCYYNYFGSKYYETNDEIQKFGKEIRNFSSSNISSDNTVIVNGEKYKVGKTEYNKTTYFNDKNGKADFLKLILQVKKFN